MAQPSASEIFVGAQRLAQAQRLSEALAAYKQCVALYPEFVPAIFALGQLLAQAGDFANAHQLLAKALKLSGGDSRAAKTVASALADILAMAVPTRYDPGIEADMLRCFEIDDLDVQLLAGATAAVILCKYGGSSVDVAQLSRDPLFLAFLTRCINCSPAMERFLTLLRQGLTDRFSLAGAKLSHHERRLACAVAIQAFAGQYVWPADDDEIAAALGASDPIIGALYKPLAAMGERAGTVKKGDRLANILIKRTLRDLAVEGQAARHLPCFGALPTGGVSRAVQAHYEEHPYPPWHVAPAPRQMPLASVIAALPGAVLPSGSASPLAVLVAGAGTGYEAIGLAKMDPASTIMAIDLSAASLAYAQRMAVELSIESVEFMQGDILNLSAAGRTFDIIYSTGVLHHMADPKDGLHSLCGVLNPGGFVRLSLYSERARAPINDARALIADRDWPPTADGIRAFRHHVFAAPDDSPLAALRDSHDFYSVSGCRDLAFHECEHQFTLPQIAAMVGEAGLTVVGFDVEPDIGRLFDRTFGTAADVLDLNLWDELERSHPSLFVEMYQIWCQLGR